MLWRDGRKEFILRLTLSFIDINYIISTIIIEEQHCKKLLAMVSYFLLMNNRHGAQSDGCFFVELFRQYYKLGL